MAICRICSAEVAKLARCHIYPDAMTKEAGGEDRQLVGITIRDGISHVSQAGAGLYDSDIVCHACEQRFHWADDYAIRFWRRALSLEGDFAFPHDVVFELPSYYDGGMLVRTSIGTRPMIEFPCFRADGARLHAFAMNTLYRALLSDRWEFRQVTDQTIAQEVRPTLFGQGRTIDSGRSICLIITRDILGSLTIAPWLKTGDGQDVYLLQMPHLAIYIAADHRPLLPAMEDIKLNGSGSVHVYRRRNPERFELDPAAEAIAAAHPRICKIFGRPRHRKVR